MNDLTILCVTRAEACVRPLIDEMGALAERLHATFLLAADGLPAFGTLSDLNVEGQVIRVESRGFLESVLDDALRLVRTPYVLRLDDDERCSAAMQRWLADGAYRAHDHWKFPRAHLWGNPSTMVLKPTTLWPDVQTRLSVRAKAGGRHTIHCGSPFGGGVEAPVMIEHHKFLVRGLEDRAAIVRRYDSVMTGAGTRFVDFQTPERSRASLVVGPLFDGSTMRVRPEKEILL